MTTKESWRLLRDFKGVLAREVPGWASRSARLIASGDDGCAGFVVEDVASDDRSPWQVDLRLFGIDPGGDGGDPARVRTGPESVCFDRTDVRTPEHVLSLMMVVLSSEGLGPRGARWRLATRIVETFHPFLERKAAGGDPESVRYQPVYRWVRWRLLSEPFRDTGIPSATTLRGDHRPCGIGHEGEASNSRGPLAYARGTFSGCRSLRRRARHSRAEWAETLLTYQDHPALGRIEEEREGRLLVFRGEDVKDEGPGCFEPIDFGDAEAGRRPAIDQRFDSWFSREFFSRRFMIRDMWKVVRDRLKWWTLAAFGVALVAAMSTAVWPCRGILHEPPVWVLAVGTTSLLVAMGLMIGGAVRSDGGERFTYPFLLRFAAGTVIGSAVIVATRGVWIARFAGDALGLGSDCSNGIGGSTWWMVAGLFLGLGVAGISYLILEVSMNGTSNGKILKRAGSVWLIGLGWAAIIAAIDIVIIGPTFTECFPPHLVGWARVGAFAGMALASLDLGIFFQVLWEDRPVTYPLGALRFSRHT